MDFPILNAICNIYDGTHQTPRYTESGVKFVSVENIGDLYGSTKYISKEDYKKYKIKPQKGDVLMTRIGSIGVCAVVDKNEELAYYVSLALLRPNMNILDSRYLKYAIESLHGRKELRKRTLVNAVPVKINMGDIGKITIPLPPLEIQHEIVRILDSFTILTSELIAELKFELTTRKKQYEYYRNKMLTFDMKVSFKTIGDICELSAGGDIPKERFSKERTEQYTVPIFSNGIGENALYGYTDMAKVKAPCVTVSARGTIGYPELRKEDFYPVVRLICISPKKGLRADYLKYYIETIKFQVPVFGIPQLTVPMISKYKIPILSLEVQQRIVSVLDNFDAICTELNIELPTEIEARQKQYEYYRDMLLTFVENSKIIVSGQH